MNHFEFFDLPVSFLLDETELKRKFLENSRKFHPDHFTLDSDEKQAEVLELSARNNLAYNVLRDFDRRMGYVLEIKGVLSDKGKNELPQDFLFDMMELNEALMEMEFEPESNKITEIKAQVKEIETGLSSSIQDILEGYSEEKSTSAELEKVKEVYLKKRYLWRIRENLNRFAPASKEAE